MVARGSDRWKGLTAKRHEEILGGEGNFLYFDCSGSYKIIYTYQMHQVVYLTLVDLIVYKLYLNKADIKTDSKKWKHLDLKLK